MTLRIAAKYAQYTNFTSEPDGFAHKSEVLAEHCRDVGTDYDAIVRSANFNAVIGESEADVKARVERIRARQVAKADASAVDGMLDIVTSPDSASGTPEQVIEKLTRLRELGCEYAILLLPRGGLRPLRHRTVRARGHAGGKLVACFGAGPGGGSPGGGGEARRSSRRRRSGERVVALGQRRPAVVGPAGGGPFDAGSVSDSYPGGSCGAGPAPGGGGAAAGIWPGGVTGESVRILRLVPGIAQEAQRPRTAALPVLGIRDLRHNRCPIGGGAGAAMGSLPGTSMTGCPGGRGWPGTGVGNGGTGCAFRLARRRQHAQTDDGTGERDLASRGGEKGCPLRTAWCPSC